MSYRQIITFLFGILAGSLVLAQEGSEKAPNPCKVEPIFHCVQTMDDGSAIGHFGYRNSCPERDKPFEDLDIQIGNDNFFAPGPIDRGQPKVFVPGEHVDDFEVEFTAEEVKKGTEYSWTVLKVKARVDFSRNKDTSLDCNNLSY